MANAADKIIINKCLLILVLSVDSTATTFLRKASALLLTLMEINNAHTNPIR